MTLEEAKVELEKFVKLKTTMRPAFVQPLLDAVEVVRCKDCRWYENDGYHTNCQIMRFCVEAEYYCSMGERREDGKIN